MKVYSTAKPHSFGTEKTVHVMIRGQFRDEIIVRVAKL